MILTDSELNASDRSSASSVILLILTFTLGLNSNMVTAGPVFAPSILPLTLNCSILFIKRVDFLLISFSSTLLRTSGGSNKISKPGNCQFSILLLRFGFKKLLLGFLALSFVSMRKFSSGNSAGRFLTTSMKDFLVPTGSGSKLFSTG